MSDFSLHRLLTVYPVVSGPSGVYFSGRLAAKARNRAVVRAEETRACGMDDWVCPFRVRLGGKGKRRAEIRLDSIINGWKVALV